MSTQVGESAWANTWREVEDRIRTDAATMWAVAGTPKRADVEQIARKHQVPFRVVWAAAVALMNGSPIRRPPQPDDWPIAVRAGGRMNIPTFESQAAGLWMLVPDDGFGSLHAPKPGTTRIITGNIGARTLCGLRSWPVVLPDTAEQAGTYRCPVCSDLAGLTPVGGGARVGSPNRVPR